MIRRKQSPAINMKRFFFVLFLLFSTSLIAQESVIYVAPEMARCKGMLEVMCLQIKESPQNDYNIFQSSIAGFIFEEGYEYKLLVDKSYENNASAVYSLLKILSKTLPSDTLEISNRMSTCEDTKIFDCLLYKRKSEKEWHNLYGKINGFNYKAGYDYLLLVTKKASTNMGAGRTYEYTLKKILEKKPTMVISKENREALSGKKFSLQGIKIKGKFTSDIGKTKADIVFNLDENRVSGNDGCNSFSGRVEINNSKIRFGQLVSTKMACDDEKLDVIIRNSLSEINKFKISNGTLKLYKGNSLLLEYTLIMEDILPEKK